METGNVLRMVRFVMKQLVFRMLQLFHGKKVQGFLHIHPIGGADVQGTVETILKLLLVRRRGLLGLIALDGAFDDLSVCSSLTVEGKGQDRNITNAVLLHTDVSPIISLRKNMATSGNMVNPCWQISSGFSRSPPKKTAPVGTSLESFMA